MGTNSLEDLMLNYPELFNQDSSGYGGGVVDLGTVDVNKPASGLQNATIQAMASQPNPLQTNGVTTPNVPTSMPTRSFGQGLKDFVSSLGQSAAGMPINMQNRGWESTLAGNIGAKVGAGLIASALTGRKSGNEAAQTAKPDFYNTPEQQAQMQKLQQLYQSRLDAAQKIKEAVQAPIIAARQSQQENLRQDRLEKIYGDRLAKITSNRSGGLGLQDAKVNQAIHLRSLVNQFYDPKSKSFNIPSAQYQELALGLASLVSNSNMALESTIQGIQQRTAAGDIQGALTYVLGMPRT